MNHRKVFGLGLSSELEGPKLTTPQGGSYGSAKSPEFFTQIERFNFDQITVIWMYEIADPPPLVPEKKFLSLTFDPD